MLHSLILINSLGERRNTWSDWRLIPSVKPTFQNPEAETKYVEIPGRSGSIDMSDYLTGNVTYKDRTGSWEFYMVDTDIHQDWDQQCDKISEFLHGKRMKIILEDDDPNYYYEGRLTLSNKNTSGYVPRLTISYRVDPQKYSVDHANIRGF